MEIKYLKHNQIDKNKWDTAIEHSCNRIVYALSWYLDIVSPKWEALIVGNYDLVMPLTVKRKYGIWYIIQPPFTQQLGVFYKKDADFNVDSFLDAIPSKYKYVDIQLNTQNSGSKKYKSVARVNFELNLNYTYQVLYKKFNNNTKRNIKKANENSLEITQANFNTVLSFKKRYAIEKISDSQYDILDKLMKSSEERGVGTGQIAFFMNKESAVSSIFLIEQFNRILYLISVSNESGKDKSAMFMIINELVKRNSEKDFILDFEGGVIPGISTFYKGFGAKEKLYYRVVINRLPWPLKLFKK